MTGAGQQLQEVEGRALGGQQRARCAGEASPLNPRAQPSQAGLSSVISLEGSAEGGKLVLNLLVIYFFVACFWMLWDQSNGNTWTLQAQSSLMDKNLGFGFKILAAQIQVVNGLLIILLIPVFT
mgnify:CR=1 FL=1